VHLLIESKCVHELINQFDHERVDNMLKTKDTEIPRVVTALIARTQLGQILKRVKSRRERFVIGRRGEPQAVILGFDDFLETFAPPPNWLEKSWKAAERNGAAKLTMRQIDAEIARARAARRAGSLKDDLDR
jgi:prevent-host-death family protein